MLVPQLSKVIISAASFYWKSSIHFICTIKQGWSQCFRIKVVCLKLTPLFLITQGTWQQFKYLLLIMRLASHVKILLTSSSKNHFTWKEMLKMCFSRNTASTHFQIISTKGTFIYNTWHSLRYTLNYIVFPAWPNALSRLLIFFLNTWAT